jgi:hypothetical protein
MNAIQQTARIDSSRRVLTLERPLPETLSPGQVSITISINPMLSAEEERKREVARNHAAWKKFFAALKEIKDEPLGDDLPPKLNLTRDLPL